jgi:hypothetical protein
MPILSHQVLQRLARFLPLNYQISQKIRKKNLDEYESEFYKELKVFNIITWFIYVTGQVMS